MSEPHEAFERRMRMLEKAFQTTQVGITVTDLDGRIVLTNEADARMHGYAPDELVGQPARLFAPPDVGRPLDRRSIASMGSWRREAVNVRKDGTVFPVRLLSDVVCDDDGEPIGVITCCENLTDRKRLEKRLLNQTFYHPLTGLPNRVLFHARIEAALASAHHRDRPFTVLVADVTRLKLVNEAFGRSAGDAVLCEVADRLRGLIAPEDMLAHLDGDEFGVLPSDADRTDDLEDLAHRIRDAFRAPIHVEGQDVFLTVNLGAAIVRAEHGDADAAVRGAELALYRAKEGATGTLEIYRPEMEDRAGRRLELESELRRALDRREFEVLYQPIVSLESREVSGLEALIRWNHPRRGLLEPDDFVPALEETGMIEEVGPWVLDRACRDLRGWEANSPAARQVTMHVNVSPRQFRSGRLPERLGSTVERAGTSPDRIQVEIVEGAVLPGHGTVVRQMEALRGTGMRIGIDDFGTGYSSFGYLHQLPIDTVKIDRSFLLPSRERDTERLVRGIVALAIGLDLEVIPEGIEEERWIAPLLDMGCSLGQGFLFGRPMNAAGIAARLG